MSSNDEFKGIQFTWKIENFRGDATIKSPCFGSHSSKFQVVIVCVNNYFHIYVCANICPIKNLSCSVAFLDCDGLPLIIKDIKIFYSADSMTCNSSLKISKSLISNKSTYLPNDTLTLQCHIWRTRLTPISLFARTRIEPTEKVMKKTFIWNINYVSSLRPPRSFERRETVIDDEFFTMKLTLNKKENFHLELTTSILQIHAKIQIILLNAWGKSHPLLNLGNTFKEGTKWNFFTKLSKDMLMSDPNKFLISDTLSLQFTCTFSGKMIFNRMVDESGFLSDFPTVSTASKESSEASVCTTNEPEINQSTKPHPPNTISQTLQEVLNEGFLSDFNLRLGDKLFPVHKVILGARSQVFRAMFTTEMKEKEDNFVDIPDVDEDTLQRLLQFVYTDKIDEDMGWESASSLYAAADKYYLELLKQRCSVILQSGLCVSSVLEVLSLADIHQDQDLKSAALDFVSLNDQDIVGTERWIEFEEVNGKLAMETCRKLYLKKMNG